MISANRILVVDDIADNTALLQAILESEGYQVIVANSGRAALDLLPVSQPDLILLDFMMPEMNGFEVIQRIRSNSQFASIPILLITGYTDFVTVNQQPFAANGLIQKPIDFEDLLNRIEQVFAGELPVKMLPQPSPVKR